MKRPRHEPTEIYLKSGRKIMRVIRHGEYYNYIIYNGHRVRVEWSAGKYYTTYR